MMNRSDFSSPRSPKAAAPGPKARDGDGKGVSLVVDQPLDSIDAMASKEMTQNQVDQSNLIKSIEIRK